MVKIYCALLNAELLQIRSLVESIFPENFSSIIEQETVFLSDGDIFECSVEPSDTGNSLSLSAEYKGDVQGFVEMLFEVKANFSTYGIVYKVEFEIIKNENYISYSLLHPAFH